MARSVYLYDHDGPPTDEEIAEGKAETPPATEFISGIPPALQRIGVTSLGYHYLGETNEDAERRLVAQIEAKIGELGQRSFAFDFGATDAIDDAGDTAPAGVKHIQMRDTVENPDQSNWTKLCTTLNVAFNLTLATQGPDGLVAFLGGVQEVRVEENVNVQTPRSQLWQALIAASSRNNEILFVGIALKAAVRAADTPAGKQAVWDESAWA